MKNTLPRTSPVGGTPALLRPFWRLFQPLTTRFDPLQLWGMVLDLLIAHFVGAHEIEPGLPIHLRNTNADLQRTQLMAGNDERFKDKLNELCTEILRTVATHNVPNVKDGMDANQLVLLSAMNMYRKNTATKHKWLDIFGEIHYFLQDKYDYSALVPCAASVELTEQWAVAQLKKMPTEHNGRPVSINNRFTAANMDCGSGRTTLAFQALYPGYFDFACESTNLLHCKYTVLNMLLHGVYGQVALVEDEKDTAGIRRVLRVWDINRWLFHVAPINDVLAGIPHVFDWEPTQSHAHANYVDKEGMARPGQKEHMEELRIDMLNRLSEGLGLDLAVKMSGDVMCIGERNTILSGQMERVVTQIAQVLPPSGKAKDLRRRLLAGLARPTSTKAALVVPPPAPAPVEEVPVRKGGLARRRG